MEFYSKFKTHIIFPCAIIQKFLLPLSVIAYERRMEIMKFDIGQDQLSATIEALNDYQARLEVDAAALASLPGAIPRKLAERKAEEARTVSELFDFYVHL